MLIPHYWAEGRIHRVADRKSITVRRHGWSNDSQADAQRHADQRTEEAFLRIVDGQPLARREMKLAYGNEGLPIREEVVAREHDTVLTRNSYGALCLNTPNVVFADVDFDLEVPSSWVWATVLGCVLVTLGAWAMGHSKTAGVLALLTLGAGHWATLLHRGYIHRKGGHEKKALARVHAFHAQEPEWHLRVYRTPKGLRVLVLHDTMLPDDPEVLAFFKAIGADPLYVRMCQQQQCFRARVSPKPWRMGIGQRIRAWNGLTPVDPMRAEERRTWVRSYDQVAEGYASCHWIETLGTAHRMTAHTNKVLAMHDALSQAREELPMA